MALDGAADELVLIAGTEVVGVAMYTLLLVVLEEVDEGWSKACD